MSARGAGALAMIAGALLPVGSAHADEASGALARTHLSAETDIFAYPFGAYSAHVGFRIAQAPHWRLGAGVFGGTLPKFFVKIVDADNRDWTIRQDSWALEGFYHFHVRGTTPFVGAYVAWMRHDARNDRDDSHSRFGQMVFWPAAGIRWFPRDAGLFFTAWAGLGFRTPPFATDYSGPSRLSAGTLYPFASVHIGYEI